jgi:hypothetical protein
MVAKIATDDLARQATRRPVSRGRSSYGVRVAKKTERESLGGRYSYRRVVEALKEEVRKRPDVSPKKLAEVIGQKDDKAFYKKCARVYSEFTFEEIGLIADFLGKPSGWPFIDDTATRILERHLAPLDPAQHPPGPPLPMAAEPEAHPVRRTKTGHR